jgi:hypothetical protein
VKIVQEVESALSGIQRRLQLTTIAPVQGFESVPDLLDVFIASRLCNSVLFSNFTNCARSGEPVAKAEVSL